MNECLNCGESVKNKYCNVSCQNKHQNTIKANKRYGEFKNFTMTCYSCGEDVNVVERSLLHPQKEKYYCNRSCANRRTHSNEVKDKIRKSLTKNNVIDLVCKNCNEKFTIPYNRRNQKFCSVSCNTQYRNKHNNLASNGGKASVLSQNRRSKNEIYFYELCQKYFNKVKNNEPMFNGWDADIIIDDIKVAVLWNGKWHYEKITESHSLKQVQNRDKIKIGEIEKLGYTPYIIKDMGRENNDFVETQFKIFLEKIKKGVK